MLTYTEYNYIVTFVVITKNRIPHGSNPTLVLLKGESRSIESIWTYIDVFNITLYVSSASLENVMSTRVQAERERLAHVILGGSLMEDCWNKSLRKK